MKRVVVTGMSAVTALGDEWELFKSKVKEGKNAVVRMDDWDFVEGLNTRLAAPVMGFQKPQHYKRQKVRAMGRVALMATVTAEKALGHANFLDKEELTNGDTGVSYGSSTGSTSPIIPFGKLLDSGDMRGVTATSYIQMMGHTAPVNIGIFFGLKGRVIPTSSACTSGSQGIGYAYESIKFGKQKAMLAGGAEELCVSEAAVFDTLYATSVRNEQPELTPKPFDQNRDGLVIGEGACTLVLEELEFAQQRGANILAEIVGFGTNCDGSHVTQPTQETMEAVMRLALDDAGITPDVVGYVNAHGTATERGDITESNATEAVLGQVPISTLKSYLGHTLGASGAIEAWASINMMRDNWFAPTLNLHNVDPACGNLDYIIDEARNIETDYVMTNNFAFGGINTSLILKRWKG